MKRIRRSLESINTMDVLWWSSFCWLTDDDDIWSVVIVRHLLSKFVRNPRWPTLTLSSSIFCSVPLPFDRITNSRLLMAKKFSNSSRPNQQFWWWLIFVWLFLLPDFSFLLFWKIKMWKKNFNYNQKIRVNETSYRW